MVMPMDEDLVVVPEPVRQDYTITLPAPVAVPVQVVAEALLREHAGAPDSAEWRDLVTRDAAAVRSAIAAEADRRLTALVAGYPFREIDTWPEQVREARAWAADPLSATPMLSAIAGGDTHQRDMMALQVLALSEQYAAAAGEIIAWRRAQEAALAQQEQQP